MYGGGFSTVPAYLADMFGTRYDRCGLYCEIAEPVIAGMRAEGTPCAASQASGRSRRARSSGRAMVSEKTGGKVGYIYVPNTGVDGQNDLFRQFSGQTGKAALGQLRRFCHVRLDVLSTGVRILEQEHIAYSEAIAIVLEDDDGGQSVRWNHRSQRSAERHPVHRHRWLALGESRRHEREHHERALWLRAVALVSACRGDCDDR